MRGKIFYVDTETTGLDETMHDIIQIAAIVEIDGVVQDEKEWKLRPFPKVYPIEAEAVIAHGYSKEEIDSFPDPRKVYMQLVNFLSNHIDRYNKFDKFSVCGYNVDFDMKFIRAFFEKSGDKYCGSWFDWNYIDPIRLMKYMNGVDLLSTPTNKLSDACKLFDIELTEAHDALADIRATRELKLKLDEVLRQGTDNYAF